MRRRMLALLAAATVGLTACASGEDAELVSGGAAEEVDHAYDDGATEAAAPEAEGDAAGSASGASLDQIAFGAPVGRKVIRDADLELAVSDADEAVRRITDVVERSGGFVASAELRNEDDYGLLGTLSLRVPTDRMTATLASIEDVADEVRSRSLASQDVTEQYADIEAQLRNLRALEVELLDLLTEIREKSSDANQVLTVFERIRQVRAEIEQLEGRRQVLDDLVSLATVDVRLVPTPSAVPIVEEDGWRVGEVVRDALRTTVAALQSIADLAIWLVLTVIPVVAVLAVVPAASVPSGDQEGGRVRQAIQGLVVALAVVALAGGAFWAALQFLDAGEEDPLAGPTDAVEAYATAWESWDIDAMAAATREPPAAFRDLHTALVETVQPGPTRVSTTAVQLADRRATSQAVVRVEIPDAGTWEWTTTITVERAGGDWLVRWTPETLHPDLRASDTFAITSEDVERSPILDRDGRALTAPGVIFEIGIEPGRLPDREEWETAFRTALPEAIEEIDETLARDDLRPGWYYPVITISQERYDEAWDTLRPVPGVIRKTAEARVGTGEGFGLHVLGRVREVEDEDEAAELGPTYDVGDEVGAYGLEAALEEQLTGSRVVRLFVRQADGDLDELLHEHQQDPSTPARTTLDLDVQTAIENSLTAVDGAAAIVAVDPASGDVLGAASRPLDGFNRAFEGRYPPGSTFKVVTAAAALRAGVVEPETMVSCPAETLVGGLRVRNAGGLELGDVPFSVAFARSCNTTFADLAAELSDGDLAETAAAFGFVGDDGDPGLPLPLSAFGASFPAPRDLAERGAAAFGQARVEASALHLATVAAAAQDGTWRAPRLLADEEPGRTIALPSGSALVLRELMELAVTEGTGASAAVPGLTVGGKTGSAEFGEGDPKPTHAWFIGYATGGEGVAQRIAFAVLVEGGGSGQDVAAPIAGRFLEELQVLAAQRAREDAAGGDDTDD